MKKSLVVLMVLSLIACVLIWLMGTSTDIQSDYRQDEASLVFRFVENHSQQHPTYQGIELFVQLVEERTEGRVKIILYQDDVIGSASEIVDQIAFGGIDFASVSGAYLDESTELMSPLCLPGLYKDRAAMSKVLKDDELSTMLREALRNEKINVLSIYPGSLRGIFYNADALWQLYGTKIAVPESPMKMVEIETLGFQPVPSLAEHLDSYFTSGYINGAEGTLLDYYYDRHYIMAKSFTITQSLIPDVIIASNTAMNQMSLEDQGIIIEAAQEAAQLSYEQILAEEASIRLLLEDMNVQVTDMETRLDDQDFMTKMIAEPEQLDLLDKIKKVLDE